ncbi:hypothetical protein [Megasphaera massiliensis]|uniref:hypothetical protein n=1 Tax=Megasphaera massiliensis TaxID=1232428 RepID=UPI003AB671DA
MMQKVTPEILEKVRLNEQYPGGKIEESIVFTLNPVPTLIVNMPGIIQPIIDDFNNGQFNFGMAYVEGVAFPAFQFGRGPWVAAPYHANMDGDLPLEAMRDIPEGGRMLLHGILIDYALNKVVGLRLVEIPYVTSQRVIEIVRLQLEEPPFGEDEYQKRLKELYKKYKLGDIIDKINDPFM